MDTNALPTVSVVVLAFNEAESIHEAITELLGVLDMLGAAYELIVVNDGSTDKTGELADAIAHNRPEIRVIHHLSNRGLGAGYRTGLREARGTYITFFPADRQFPGSIIRLFLPYMQQYELVLGCLPQRDASWTARTLSAVERALYTALFGRLPAFQGIFMIRRSALNAVELKSDGRGWAIVMELIIRSKRRGATIISVPTDVRRRANGASKVNNMRTILANVSQLLTLKRHL